MTTTWSQDYAWAFYAAACILWLIAGVGLYIALFRDRSRGRRRCPKCWYDMAGVPGLKCPECGREARKERRLHTTRRGWRLATLFALLAALGFASFRAPYVFRNGPWAAVPVPILNLCLSYWADDAKVEYESRRGRRSPLAWMDLLGAPPPVPIYVPGDWSDLLTAWYAARVLADPKSTDHAKAIDTLSGVGPHARLAVSQLRAVEGENQRLAVQVLGYLTTAQLPEALDALHYIAMRGRSPSIRVAAAAEFASWNKGKLPASLVNTLIELAHDADDSIVLAAARVVASQEKSFSNAQFLQVLDSAARFDPEFVRTSAKSWDQTTATVALDSSLTRLRAVAARRLFELAGDTTGFRERMISILSGTGEPELRPLCAGLLGEVTVADSRITPALVHAGLHDPDRSVRAVALRAAESRRDADTQLVAALIEALKDPSPEVVLAAANSLARLGPRAAAAHDALTAAANHPDASARDAIADALTRTGATAP